MKTSNQMLNDNEVDARQRSSRGRDRARGVRQTLHCGPHVCSPPPPFLLWLLRTVRLQRPLIKRIAYDRLQWRFGAAGSSPDFSRVFYDMALLGFCLELSFNVL